MTENQKELLSISYDLATMSNMLITNLIRSYKDGPGIQSHDVARVTELHNKAVRLQELAKDII